MKMVKRLAFSLFIVLFLIAAGYAYYLVSNNQEYSNTTQYTNEYTQVQGTVLSKEHTDLEQIRKQHWTLGGTRLVPQIIAPESYRVTISYGDLTTTIDSMNLYNQVEVGSVIDITLHQVYDRNHNLVEQYLELPQ